MPRPLLRGRGSASRSTNSSTAERIAPAVELDDLAASPRRRTRAPASAGARRAAARARSRGRARRRRSRISAAVAARRPADDQRGLEQDLARGAVRPSTSCSSSRSAATVPISRWGTRTVVSGGRRRSMNGMSLKPTIEMSSGQRSAARRERVVAAEGQQVVGGHDRRHLRVGVEQRGAQARAPSSSVKKRANCTHVVRGVETRGTHRLEEAEVAPVSGGQVLRSGRRGRSGCGRAPTTCSTASLMPRRSLTVTAGTEPSSRLRLTSTSGVRAGAELGEQLAVEPRGGGDEAVDLAGAHRLEVAALALGVVVGVDDQRRCSRRRRGDPRSRAGSAGTAGW